MEYTIYKEEKSKVAEKIPDVEWTKVNVTILNSIPIPMYYCEDDGKKFIKECGDNGYFYRWFADFRKLFKRDGRGDHNDKVMDVTNAIIPGKIEKRFLLISYESVIVQVQILNWQLCCVNTRSGCWILFHANQNNRDYFKVCPDVFPCVGEECAQVPGYHNGDFEKMFNCGWHCRSIDINT
jgi:hypothetical protein